jgi:hypothetical protein
VLAISRHRVIKQGHFKKGATCEVRRAFDELLNPKHAETTTVQSFVNEHPMMQHHILEDLELLAT